MESSHALHIFCVFCIFSILINVLILLMDNSFYQGCGFIVEYVCTLWIVSVITLGLSLKRQIDTQPEIQENGKVFSQTVRAPILELIAVVWGSIIVSQHNDPCIKNYNTTI